MRVFGKVANYNPRLNLGHDNRMLGHEQVNVSICHLVQGKNQHLEGQIGSDWFQEPQILVRRSKDWPRLIPGAPDWPRLVPEAPDWPRLAPRRPRLFQIGSRRPRLAQIARGSQDWFRMAPERARLSPRDPYTHPYTYT